MKKLSSRRAKALSISPKVKERVYNRDNRCCVWCSHPGLPEAHYISRAHGGLGIEQNVLTLCRTCHDRYDRGTREEREEMKDFFRAYLRMVYTDWKEEDLIYRKEKN